MAVLILITSSFDIALIIQAGGNYRFCQLIAAAMLVLAALRLLRGSMVPVLGLTPLLIWFVFQLLFVPSSDFWPKSVGYCLWLFLDIGMVISFTQLFQTAKAILRWYLYSFTVIAAFGIVQFLLPLLGLGEPLIEQWWIPGRLARVNGFSYEPSYFATYLLTGFVLAGSLRRCRSPLLSRRVLLTIYLLTALGIILSSSRMGITLLILDVLLSQIRPWLAVANDLRKFCITPSRLRALVPSLLILAMLTGVFAGITAFAKNNPAVALMFLNGTGISDTAAHSVIQREDALKDTLEVAWRHPWVGRSLGGVSSAIAEIEGERINSFEASKQFEGMNVFAEVLAASGVIGTIPFACFLITTIYKPLKLAQRVDPLHAAILRGLVRSLIFTWAILQFNQNLLRPYLWTHIAILAATYAAARRFANTPLPIPDRLHSDMSKD
jgi:hypothetical protein